MELEESGAFKGKMSLYSNVVESKIGSQHLRLYLTGAIFGTVRTTRLSRKVYISASCMTSM